jgi:hypothetical protein
MPSLVLLLARKLPSWKQALMIVQPDAAKRRQAAIGRRNHCLDQANGAGEPLLGSRTYSGGAAETEDTGQHAVRKYLKQVRPPGSSKQNWRTFLRNHTCQVWACDFLQTYAAFFRTIFVCIIVELDSRRVVHFGVTPRRVDSTTTAGGHAIWCKATILDPGQ